MIGRKQFVLFAIYAVFALYPAASAHCQENPALSPELVAAENERIRVIEKASRASVGVFGPGGAGGGSGVVISPDGLALTNYHVVQGNGPFMKCSMPDGVLYDAVLVGIDPVGDVALIQLHGRDNFPVAELGDSDDCRAGQWCFAVGNPFLLATNFQPTVTSGIISGVHRYQYPAGTLLEYTDCIQTDAAINPGNSGGPLFNSAGQLIGINGRGSFEKRGRVNVGVGYAISINQIKLFFDHLMSGRIVDHATSGATFGTDDEGRIRVTNILESSDAYRQGMRFDDRLVSFAGREIETVNEYKNLLGIFPAGFRVSIGLERDGLRFDRFIRLSSVHGEDELADLVAGASGPPKAIPEGETPADEDPESEEDEHPLAGLYQSRRGFANYHFNQIQMERLWNGFQQHGEIDEQFSRLELTGTDAAGNSLKIVLSDDQSGVLMNDDTTFIIETKTGIEPEIGERYERLLLALHLWRRMLVNGPENYGDCYYVGSLPGVRVQQDVDTGDFRLVQRDVPPAVVAATYDITSAEFAFQPDTAHLLSMTLFPDPDAAPLELQFSDYQVSDQLTVPGTILFVDSDTSIEQFSIERYEFFPLRDGEEDE